MLNTGKVVMNVCKRPATLSSHKKMNTIRMMAEGDNVHGDEQFDREKEEGLELLFGSLFSSDLNASAWENESVQEDEESVNGCNNVGLSSPLNRDTTKTVPSVPKIVVRGAELPQDKTAFEYAHHFCNGKVSKPPVKIVDFSSLGRGFGLVATRRIPKGEIIYAERAAVASQTPVVTMGGNVQFRTRGCQHCFRSLEPVSSCQIPEISLPSPELWPVKEFDFRNDEGSDSLGVRSDNYGRMQCLACKSWFCSDGCRAAFHRQFHSCCEIAKVVNAFPRLLVPDLTSARGNDEGDSVDVQPSLVLAVRMFGSGLHLFRSNKAKWNAKTFVDGLCGDASDVEPLELGVPFRRRETDGGSVQYSLSNVFEYLVQVFAVTETEQQTFSLEYFNLLAAKSARNGFGLLTQSPFKAYYAALLRASGGRCSHQHEMVKGRVARALGSSSGKLERGMDRIVEERVAVEIAAVFPLTARINHSCSPKAEVRSQEFVDCHMDLVAIADIEQDEEISISYIRCKQNRQKRQRELAAKYLFSCDCERCCSRDG